MIRDLSNMIAGAFFASVPWALHAELPATALIAGVLGLIALGVSHA